MSTSHPADHRDLRPSEAEHVSTGHTDPRPNAVGKLLT